jgi:LPS sulfotransferase NodH
MAEGNRGWEELMARSPVAHIRVEYEEMVAAPVATAEGVLRFLGAPSDGVTFQVRTTQQADSVNDNWIRQYTLDPES